MLGIVTCHKVAVHDEALAQVACDDEPRVEEQDNVQCEEEACRGHSSRLGPGLHSYHAYKLTRETLHMSQGSCHEIRHVRHC